MHIVPRIACLFLTALMLAACAARSPGGIAGELAELRAAEGIPAAGAAVVSSGGIIDLAVDGVRHLDRTDPLGRDDAWHIGSVTKTMTATLVAQRVESGKWRWGTRISDVLPAEVRQGKAAYSDVTVAQLLSHEAGIVPLVAGKEILAVPELPEEVIAQRRALVEWLLKQPPAAVPGEEFEYSNAGFSILGAMLETATGKSWNAQVRERIFRPLGMASAGFGWPGKDGDADGVAWGHMMFDDGLRPVAPDGDYQLPEFLAPAGAVHASLPDMAKYAADYLKAWHGEGVLLRQDTVQDMFQRRIRSGLGWGVQEAFGFQRVVMYSGSAETFLMLIVVIPEADRAFIVVTNAYSESIEREVVLLLRKLVSRYAVRRAR